jgi:hypothetical protein
MPRPGTSLYGCFSYEGLSIRPGYLQLPPLPTYTDASGIADIECFDTDYNPLFEVTLMCARNQAINEIPAITRHLQKALELYPDKTVFSVLIAPSIHADTRFMTAFSYHQYRINILALTVSEFIVEQ